MSQKQVGHVVDENGLTIEVWLGEGHVFLLYGGSQIGDFPLGAPGGNEIERLAERVAKGDAKILACTGPDDVIDDNDAEVGANANRIFFRGHTVH